MTAANRGAVQRSVAKPNAQGLASTHRNTRAACGPVSLGGRPRPGRVASPASPRRPRRRQRLSHRHTDRSLTSSTSATCPGVSPPSVTISTAKRRTCSADSAFLGGNMETMVAHARFY
jgi:hypothetical protein